SKTELSMTEGDSANLTATIAPENATDKSVTWTSSDASVASVSSEGIVTAVKAGTATITATSANGKTATCKVKVAAKIYEVTGITLSNNKLSLTEGETATLTATIAPENATDKTVTWTSSDASVASVSDKGVVTAVKAGTATITATSANGKTANCTVTVAANIISVESVAISKTELSLTEGDTANLTATIAPENATDKSVTWTSSDASVATVSDKGVVTAVKAGTATITVASSNGKTATCKVTVAAKVIDVTGITLSKTELSMTEGDSANLTATIAPENATDKSVTWTSSDASIATVSDKGVVTAVKAGTATITATSANGKTATCKVTVAAKIYEVTGITLSNTKLSLTEGETATLTATIAPENATDKTVTWTSSDASVASVSDKGVVTAVKAGTATITATSANGKTANCTVTVAANIISVESVAISKTELSLTEGDTANLTATIAPENATDKSVTWTSSDEAVATVSADGVVTAVKAGTATITAASSNGKTATCTVTVTAKVIDVTGITLSDIDLSMTKGETITLTATIDPENATDKTVTWTSSDEAVATVDAEGNVTAIAVGEAVITAACGNVSASCHVTVLPILVESLTIDPAEWRGKEGSEFTITATVLPDDAADKTVTFESSDTSIATVDAEGNVKVLKEGTCVITVSTVDGSDLTAECVITSLSGVETIFADPDASVDVFDMNGVMLKRGCSREELKQLKPAIYILRSGNTVVKTILR
ncbi:MAG: Ig-like domain-containing protein, partial [Muribaculaceae bacterium]|nr:Ig-like domain-containing protein [Muribaculaceae bacterium]